MAFLFAVTGFHRYRTGGFDHTGWLHERPIDKHLSFDMLYLEESQAWQLLSLKPHHCYSGRYHGQSSRDR